MIKDDFLINFTNAKVACEKTKENLKQDFPSFVIDELLSIQNQIQKEISLGHYTLKIDFVPHEKTINFLKEKGYKCEYIKTVVASLMTEKNVGLKINWELDE